MQVMRRSRPECTRKSCASHPLGAKMRVMRNGCRRAGRRTFDPNNLDRIIEP
jgi:hypothetical protein